MPTRQWALIRVDDTTHLGAYPTKMEAIAAASRLSIDGCGYEVIEQLVPEMPSEVGGASTDKRDT
jgi:hypothetical protein